MRKINNEAAEAAKLYSLLPSDPIEMTDGDIARATKKAGKAWWVGKLAPVIRDMRARRDATSSDPDHISSTAVGSTWYWATYLSSPANRREHVVTCVLATAVA